MSCERTLFAGGRRGLRHRLVLVGPHLLKLACLAATLLGGSIACSSQSGAADGSSAGLPLGSTSAALSLEDEVQDAFNNAACYCEAYLITPTENVGDPPPPPNPDFQREWVKGQSSDVCTGDPRLAAYEAYVTNTNNFLDADRKAGRCIKSTSTSNVSVPANARGTRDATRNGCMNPVAQDESGTFPSAGFCRADFNYCLAQQLRLKADSLARPPTTSEARIAILGEARNRFERAGSEFSHTLTTVDRKSDATTCVGPEACYEWMQAPDEHLTHSLRQTSTCETICDPDWVPHCHRLCDPPSPTDAEALAWCQGLETNRRNTLLGQTPDPMDWTVVVSRTDPDIAHHTVNTPYTCVIHASYRFFQPDTTTRERDRVKNGYGAVAEARLADAVSQSIDLVDVEVTERMANSDGLHVTSPSYVSDIWSAPSGQRFRALRAIAGERNVQPGSEPVLGTQKVQKDDGARRAVALLAQYKIPLPFERCAAADHWEAATGYSAWATAAYAMLDDRIVAELHTTDPTQVALHNLHGIDPTHVLQALDLLRDRLAILDEDYTMVVAPGEPNGPDGCPRAYIRFNSVLSRQRNPLTLLTSVSDGSVDGAECAFDNSVPSPDAFRRAGGARGLDHVRALTNDLATTHKLQNWATDSPLVSARNMLTTALGRTWSEYVGCFYPNGCNFGQWAIYGDVAPLAGAQLLLARSEEDVSCLLHGHRPGAEPVAGGCNVASYPLSDTTAYGVSGLALMTADFGTVPAPAKAYIVLRVCDADGCGNLLVDVINPFAFDRHPFGGNLLNTATRLLARDLGNPGQPAFNSLGIDNGYIPSLDNANNQEDHEVRANLAKTNAQDAKTELTAALNAEASYLTMQTALALNVELINNEQKNIMSAACGNANGTPCTVPERAAPTSLVDLHLIEKVSEPSGFGDFPRCTDVLTRAVWDPPKNDTDALKGYVRDFVGAKLRCTHWAILELVASIKFSGLPKDVVDEILQPTTGGTFSDVGGDVGQLYLEVYRQLRDMGAAFRQFNTNHAIAEINLQRAVLLIDDTDPDLLSTLACVAGRLTKAAAAAAAAVAFVGTVAASGGGTAAAAAAAAATSAPALLSLATTILTGLESALSMSQCFGSNAGSEAALLEWSGALESIEKMFGFADSGVHLIGSVASVDGKLRMITDRVVLANERANIERNIAANTYSGDPSFRALMVLHTDEARRKLLAAQHTAFVARRSAEFRTASDLRWLDRVQVSSGIDAPAVWANDVFIVNRAYLDQRSGDQSTAVSQAAESISTYADEIKGFFMPYFGDAYHFSKQSGTAVFSVHDMLGGGPLLERLQFQCMDRDEPLWGGHLPDETVTAPCAPHGGVRPGKDSTLNILYDSVIASLAVPDIMSGYVARHVLLGDATHRNVNYRINKIGINLVANGLLDCNAPGVEDPDSCPRNQTVEYVLTHDGSVGLENLLGEHRFYHLYDGVLSSTALANGTVLSEPLDPVSQVPYFAPFEQTALHARPLAGMYKLVLRSRNELVWQNLEDLQVFVDYEFWAPQGLTNQPQLTESAPAPIR